jgi:hypothetical protein
MVSGPVRQPYAGVDFIPQSGIYKFGYRTVATLALTVIFILTFKSVFLLLQTSLFFVYRKFPTPAKDCACSCVDLGCVYHCTVVAAFTHNVDSFSTFTFTTHHT